MVFGFLEEMKPFCPSCTHYPVCDIRKSMEKWLVEQFIWVSNKERIELTNEWHGLLAERCAYFEIQTPKNNGE